MTFRTRNQSNLVPSIDTRTVTYTGQSPVVSTSQRGYTGKYGIMNDWVTSQFQKKRDAGEVVMNPMSSTFCEITSSPKGLTMQRSGTGWVKDEHAIISAHVTNMDYLRPLGSSGIDVSNLTTAAITKAYANVSPPDVLGLVCIKEAKQTLALLHTPVKALYKLIQQAKRKNIKGVGTNFSDLYLQIKFGALPLMMDIDGTLKALGRTLDDRIRSTARASESDTSSWSGVHGVYNDAVFGMTTAATRFDQVVCRATVLYEADVRLLHSLGFSAASIAPSVWEALPWSFAYDYLVNLGDIISALSATVGTKILGSCVVISREIKVRSECSGITLTPAAIDSGWGVSISPVGGSHTGYYKTKERRLTSLQDIGLAYTTGLTPTQVANSLALLTQRLSKIRRA